jgi:hypothetical protein
MDRKTLVRRRVVDGRRLLGRLLDNGIPVKMACWTKTGDDRYWSLYIATDHVERKGIMEAYGEVLASLRSIEGTSISSSDVKLIGANHPITREVLGFRSSVPTGSAIRLHDERLTSLGTGEFYIYPQFLPKDSATSTHPHGARVRLMQDGSALVRQTIKRDDCERDRYVIDNQRECRVDPGDDAKLGAAVRAALEGRL